MKDFIESYHQQVLGAVARLARLTDESALESLTREILADLWERKEALEAESRKGIFIYKVVLVHVFSYLREKGEEKKINSLQQILLINPQNLKPLQDTSLQGDVGI